VRGQHGIVAPVPCTRSCSHIIGSFSYAGNKGRDEATVEIGRDGFSGHPRVPASCSALLIQIAKGCHDFTKYFDNDEEMCDT
jgi:hypothetical protein